MPIRPELRHHYGPAWRKVIRPFILTRAGNKCEKCGVPNNTSVTRAAGAWLDERVEWEGGIKQVWRDENGQPLPYPPRGVIRYIRVVLTVGHLNHVAGDDRYENLQAWCQWCHLAYDLKHHAETRSIRKDSTRPLLAAVQERRKI